MLRSIKSVLGYTIAAQDGSIGKSKDFLFEDTTWSIRYLVVDTGGWLPGRKVLIAPEALLTPNWTGKMFPVELTRKKVETSPPLEMDMPVSRQYEDELRAHYAWTYGSFGAPGPIGPSEKEKESEGDPHLRSAEEVMGYHIAASDGDIGHVEDFIVDDESWTLRYMVVDTRNWLPGRKVLLALSWIEEIDWANRKVAVSMSRDRVSKSPEFDPTAPINREYEVRLYDFYGRPAYWEPQTQR